MNRRAFFRAVGKALLAIPVVGVSAKLFAPKKDTIFVHEGEFGIISVAGPKGKVPYVERHGTGSFTVHWLTA